MDVAYALNEIYSGIYSTQEGTRSLTLDGYDINKLSISLPQTLYLAHTQAGKTELKAMGCGQERTGCPLPLKWLSWTMADRPVVLVNGCRATGTGPPSRRNSSAKAEPKFAKFVSKPPLGGGVRVSFGVGSRGYNPISVLIPTSDPTQTEENNIQFGPNAPDGGWIL
ncbi:hypothetical protein EVAR_84179_1 [Eumeta japonica]|uniref:Uncharacterized protein n=1 Tax=Eumeta variegata TaxID=151549 RepID=A0A4C1ZXJ3_EUMVA|nr:hypothetical protein EVAR_84179_1 [Eumeta japonica]